MATDNDRADESPDDSAPQFCVTCSHEGCGFGGAYSTLAAACAVVIDHSLDAGHAAHITAPAHLCGDSGDTSPSEMRPLDEPEDSGEWDPSVDGNDDAWTDGGCPTTPDSDAGQDTMWLRVDLAPGTQLGWEVHDAADLAEQFLRLGHGDAIKQVLPVSDPEQVLPDLSRAANADGATPPSLSVQPLSATHGKEETAVIASDAAEEPDETAEITVKELLSAVMAHAGSTTPGESKDEPRRRVRVDLTQTELPRATIDARTGQGTMPIQDQAQSECGPDRRVTANPFSAGMPAVRFDGGEGDGDESDGADVTDVDWHDLTGLDRDLLCIIASQEDAALTGAEIYRQCETQQDEVASSAWVYRRINRLAEQGLISKNAQTLDARTTNLRLTETGRALIAAHRDRLQRIATDAATEDDSGDTSE